MKMHPALFSVVLLFVVQSCIPVRPLTVELQYRNYPVSHQKQDSSLIAMLLPYKDSVARTMTKVIGFATKTMSKSNSGSLGNFFTDAMRQLGEKYFKTKIDAAIMNPGGIRSYIPRGEITVGKMYELMPFDNLLVLQEMTGKQLKVFLDHSAGKGGWAVSGITMEIKDRLATNVLLNGKPLNDKTVYVIALPDYVANGGDNSEMLRNIPQVNIGYLLRDALIEFVEQFTRNGRPVTASPETRVIHAKVD